MPSEPNPIFQNFLLWLDAGHAQKKDAKENESQANESGSIRMFSVEEQHAKQAEKEAESILGDKKCIVERCFVGRHKLY